MDNQGTKEAHGVFDVWMHNKFSWDSFNEEKAVTIENVVINNVKAEDGAALKNDGSNVILKNVSINNTTSSAWGALRLIGGLQYSSPDGSWKEDTVIEANAVNPSSTIVRISDGNHMKYAGNKAFTNCEKCTYSDMGGFAYLDGDAHLSFDIGQNASLVIGEEPKIPFLGRYTA